MAKKKKSNFKSKVAKNSKRQKEGPKNYGYLKLPGNVSIFSAPPGEKVKMDILAYEVTNPKHLDRDEDSDIAVPGTPWYRVPFFTHRNVGANNDAVVCLKTFGEKCPICEEKARLEKDGGDEEDIKALKSSARNLYCIIPYDVEKGSGEVHIWDMSQYLFQNLLNEELEEDENNADFPDLEEGKSLKVRFDSKSFAGNTFAEASRIDFLPRKKPIPEKLINLIPKMDDLLVVHSYEKLEQMLFELPETDEEVAPKKEKKAKKEKKGKKKEEEVTRKKKKVKTDKNG